MSARIGRVFSVTVTTALYRRYRPDSFADVIGQEHVTEPLMTALRKNRVNHAYLFSGPRGCGKTTSARILARCLNCAQGPTDTPCGTCPSCVELARGGSGSLDVIEIDAASHGGVDDARDLRERATFAPVRDRYKIFIIDEAHMVTSAGFNALLKIVEEPPEHIKFIFATTEPEKVIGTIRSRTHHYPFRLVPPEPLMAYLELLCRQENVPVAPGVLSLVIRAGGGSVRDSLSVLDQLMAGAGPNGLDYELAVALLGYTHASLLDDVVEAIAASDAATVFRAVDRVIQTGHDPRRFVEDLLERFRDLIIVQAMPESAHAILRGMPADQIARLQNQAHNLGAAELSRAADVTNTALTEMTGATSPRLHLELLCARILLPSSEQNERGLAARIDRVERRLNYAGNDVGAPAAAVPAAPVPAAAPAAPVPAAAPAAAAPAAASPISPPGSRPGSEEGHPAPRPEQGTPAQPPVSDGPAGHQPAAQAPAAQSATVHAPSEAAAGQDVSPVAAGPRSSLTPPRVSTNDWPVEEPGRQRAQGAAAASIPAATQPDAAPQSPVGPRADGASQPNAAGQQASSPQAPAPQASAPQSPGPSQQPPAGSSPAAPPAMGDVEVLRRAWPDVLQALTRIKRSTWALVEPNAQVSAFDGTVLTLSFTTQGLAGAFGRADHADNLRQAIHKTVGIDCQIHAVAGGASQASSEPNPKAPASPVVQATSADVAWGLAPAPAQPAQGQAAPAGAAGSAESSAVAGAPTGPGSANAAASSAVAGTTPGSPLAGHSGSSAVATSPSAAAAVGAAPARPAGQGLGTPANAAGADAGQSPYPSAGGDYSYSDDDWGPPRDEDAPPLDEEPPMDWEPSARPGNRPGNRPGAASPAVSPSATGSSNNGTSGRNGAAPSRETERNGSSTAASARAATPPAGAPHDPWSRAVEQAPGVWVVGDKSNVGAKPAPAATADNLGTQATVPHYAPATAQVPQPSIPVAAAAPAPVAGAGWEPGTAANSGSGPAGGRFQAASPERSPAPEFAMASAAPAVAPPTAAAATTAVPARPQPTAAASSAVRTETRQSLYQRLSNSPEAEAGRAQAPARTVAEPSAYIQDIPSADDETIEESGVFGRAAVERILGGKLIEERSPDGSPIPPRY
ncbi:DNA polymerase III subunit gamma and tau [Pseudarthrobacter phenanthrenivorans]|uniref:DNA polymerase III subunit gamma and tau n=1 Tax=Pseudarthrobacter phenanthrenivorans TaxID=361575 RepID=UPI0009DE8898